ncbi:MAG TPA: plastocyanin/azurin family copper-binding protein [Thermoleophilaceae bacterium]|nr:plastocyanin/azurin family copper-binding protein [Thermoleophilaceae bacterium]
MRSRFVSVVVAGGSLALFAVPAAQADRTVEADGNPAQGGLQFDPADIRVAVGDKVTWVNTDTTVPHTATENHGLWDLTGTYGVPGNYGFGPAEKRSRKFEAGTQSYYCKVHPTQMRGVVRVPVKAHVESLLYGKRKIVMRWTTKPPATGQVYDVQLKRAGETNWRKFRTGTREQHGARQTGGQKVTWSIRARLRKASDASQATGWSPVVRVQA